MRTSRPKATAPQTDGETMLQCLSCRGRMGRGEDSKAQVLLADTGCGVTLPLCAVCLVCVLMCSLGLLLALVAPTASGSANV